jgi:hypothetical protein
MFTERQKARMEILAWATDPLELMHDPRPTPGSSWWPAGGMDVVVSDWLPDGTMMYLRDQRSVAMNPDTLSRVMCAVYRKEIVRKDLERIVARVMGS